MADVNININGKNYGISCDGGQEGRIVALAEYVEGKIQQISRAGGAWNENHLLVLTSLLLADEALKDHSSSTSKAGTVKSSKKVEQEEVEEALFSDFLQTLSQRIDALTQKVKAA